MGVHQRSKHRRIRATTKDGNPFAAEYFFIRRHAPATSVVCTSLNQLPRRYHNAFRYRETGLPEVSLVRWYPAGRGCGLKTVQRAMGALGMRSTLNTRLHAVFPGKGNLAAFTSDMTCILYSPFK
ncbi:unnamed protein product [Ectocarpus sp. 12 AP-2014]